MKTKIIFTAALTVIINLGSLNAQYGNNEMNISLTANYTTSSKMYLSPYAQDPFVRGQYESLDNIYSYGVELKYRLSEPLIAGLNVEYVRKTGVESQIIGIRQFSTLAVDVNDGYTLIPVELSVYYLMPFSSEQFKFFMGGGLGIYFGSHLRTFQGIDVSNEERKFAFGIHVNIGMEYMFTEYFSVTGGMKFRDPEFEVKSRYNENIFIYNDQEVLLRDETFDSKINIDGVIFYVGIGLGIDLY